VEKAEDRLYIMISNTGEEIPEETVQLILSRKLKHHKDRKQKGHTTGIGIDNVLKRLRLFYEEEDVMNITYGDGKTKFTLILPMEKNKTDLYEINI
jgi:sensor histidine kinase YesM